MRERQVETESGGPVLAQEATAIRRLIDIASSSHRGLPVGELVAPCARLSQASFSIDVVASRMIGVPVVVLRERSANRNQPVLEKLSVRERDVATLIAAGFNNARIARELGISISTVKDHVHHALTKTRLRSRTELAAALAREGV